MSVTRENYLEVWPEGATAYASRHVLEREAIEAARTHPPGTHLIKVDGGDYLRVTVAPQGTPPPESVVQFLVDDQDLDGLLIPKGAEIRLNTGAGFTRLLKLSLNGVEQPGGFIPSDDPGFSFTTQDAVIGSNTLQARDFSGGPVLSVATFEVFE